MPGRSTVRPYLDRHDTGEWPRLYCLAPGDIQWRKCDSPRHVFLSDPSASQEWRDLIGYPLHSWIDRC